MQPRAIGHWAKAWERRKRQHPTYHCLVVLKISSLIWDYFLKCYILSTSGWIYTYPLDMIYWLVVSNMTFIFQNIWDVILPIDELIFCKMVKTTKPVSMCGAFLKWGYPKIIRNWLKPPCWLGKSPISRNTHVEGCSIFHCHPHSFWVIFL